MKLYIDGDSCPKEIRSVIMKAGKRHEIDTLFVANRKLRDIEAPARQIVPEAGPEAADRYILESAVPGDLVITRDIPLAEELAGRQITVINDRGDIFTEETVRERRSIRDQMKVLRESGAAPPLEGKSYGFREKKRFSDTFDRELTRLKKKINAIP